jgi:hypothetical protein
MTIKQILSRTAARLAVMALVVVGGATMAATSAQAATYAPIIHDQSQLCLDASISKGVRLNTCKSNNSYQDWNVSGYYLIHEQTGLCLDGSISKGVRLNTCKQNSYQRWSTTDGYKLEHDESGLCLDGSVSQGVQLKTCNYTTYQDWALLDA